MAEASPDGVGGELLTPAADGEGFVPVAAVADLPPGALLRVAYGEEPVVLANVNGRLHALADTCLHAGASLSEGGVRAGMVICPWHAWAYDPASGQLLNPRGTKLRIRAFAVRVDGNTIALGPAIPPPAPEAPPAASRPAEEGGAP